MKFDVARDEEEIIYVILNGKSLPEEELGFAISEKDFEKIPLEKLPTNVPFHIFEDISEFYTIGRVNFGITKLDNELFDVTIEDSGRKKYWDGPFNLKYVFDSKKEILDNNETTEVSYYNDGEEDDYLTLTFSKKFISSSIPTLIQSVKDFYDELEKESEALLINKYIKKQ